MASQKLKLKLAYETEIYISDAGYLVIKQDNDVNPAASMVMLTPHQSVALNEFIEMNKAEHSDLWYADQELSEG